MFYLVLICNTQYLEMWIEKLPAENINIFFFFHNFSSFFNIPKFTLLKGLLAVFNIPKFTLLKGLLTVFNIPKFTLLKGLLTVFNIPKFTLLKGLLADEVLSSVLQFDEGHDRFTVQYPYSLFNIFMKDILWIFLNRQNL